MTAPDRCAPNARTSGTVLAFDYGKRRIGVAVGDPGIGIAHPIATVDSGGRDRGFAAIARLIAEWRPALVVVGAPARTDGAAHPIALKARRFARALETRYGVRTALVDEHLTSNAAAQRLREAGTSGKRLASSLDAAAAAEILVNWFEQSGRPAPVSSGEVS
jgi:putative Holliday junction resolvase